MAHAQEAGFVTGRPVATLTVAPPDLAVALPTALLLVDYAARLKPTPTPWPRRVANALPGRLLVDALPLRALLGHGDGLRCWLVRELPETGDGGEPAAVRREWPALRAYLAALPVEGVLDLVEYGVHNNLRYAAANGDQQRDDVRLLLEAADGFPAEERRRLRVQAVLTDWGLPDAAELSRLVIDPEWFRSTLLVLLEAIWAEGFDAVWTESRDALATAVTGVEEAPPGTSPEAWIGRVTGLRVDERWRWLLDRAATVVVMPCPLLGRHVSVYDAGGGTVYVLWEPEVRDTPPSGGVPAAGVDLGSLARLAPLATALGDDTRLTILLVIARGDRPTAQDIAGELGVHASTVSRQVAQLERVGLVTVTRDGPARRHELDRAVVRRLCRTLEHALG